MSSRLLRILALLLALGAVGVGYIGYHISRPQPVAVSAIGPPAIVEPAQHDVHAVVVAVKDIAAGHQIAALDVQVVKLPVRDVRAFKSVEAVVGTRPNVAVAAGSPLFEHYFVEGGRLSRTLQEGERAIAVKVDEVTGGGGWLRPGDHVDVLVYLRGGNHEVENSSAQIVLQHVRVLAYGSDLVGAPQPTDDGKAARTSATSMKSVTLAVRRVDASRLMLAANAGQLRLAVVGVDEAQHMARAASAPERPIILHDLARLGTSSQRRVAPRGSEISLYHGSKEEVVQTRVQR